MKTRAEIEKKFEISRRNLLSVSILSLLNMLLSLLNANISFLFSATAPLFLFEVGRMFSEEMGMPALLMVSAVIALVMIAAYGVCYFLAKKYRAFMLVALIFFSIDTVFLLWTLTLGFDFSIMLDIAFHAWVLYYLAVGTKAWSDLNKMPPDMPWGGPYGPPPMDYPEQ